MGNNLCPFLPEKDGAAAECLGNDCYIYDREKERCIFASLNGDISLDTGRIEKAIAASGADNGKLIKKIGGMMNKTYRPLNEFLKAFDNGKKYVEARAEENKWHEENTGLLKEILAAVAGGATGEGVAHISQPSAEGGSIQVLEEIRDSLAGQYAQLTGMSGVTDILNGIKELNEKIFLGMEKATSGVSAGDGFNTDTIKMLLDTLKKPLAASLKIQQDILAKSEALGAITADRTAEIISAVDRQSDNFASSVRNMEGSLAEAASGLNAVSEGLAGVPRESFFTEYFRDAGEVSGRYLEGLDALRENTEKISEAVSSVSEEMRRIAESQSALISTIAESMKSFDRFIAVQEKYFESEETSMTLKRAEKFNDSGLSLLMSGDYDNAITNFKEALRLNSRLWGAYSNMGVAFSEKGEKEKASAVFKKLIDMNPDFSEGYYNLGMMLFEGHDPEKAAGFFKRSVEKNPDFSKAYISLGDALFEMEKYDSALSSWKKALALDPTLDEVREKIEKMTDLGLDGDGDDEEI